MVGIKRPAALQDVEKGPHRQFLILDEGSRLFVSQAAFYNNLFH
jgi:hypothetical protein